jgi:glycine/D-amino acid oxidase-like deaminating enzyme/nitrite reductase/ring-hydroxylating ferredoxin subunit
VTSLWLDTPREIPTDPFTADAIYDTIVIGGGLAGLCTALLLARSGQHVAVVEARELAAVTTGNTTGKLSLLHGSQLSRLLKHTSPEVARAYVDANLEGQQWLLRYCADHSLPVQRRDAYSYAATPEGADRVRQEYDACRSAGLDVVLESDTELPFPTHGAVRLADQAQIDPLDVVEKLAGDIRARGGRIMVHTRATDVTKAGTRVEVLTTRGGLYSDRVVLATGMPFLAKGAYFARLQPLRSYAVAFAVPGPIPRGMYLSVDKPTRSLRTAPGTGLRASEAPAGETDPQTDAGTELLLVGGNGHVVGRESPTSALVADLEEWTHRYFPGARRTHSWSAQDYRSLDRAPHVGPITPGDEHVYVATGFNKWGMTNAVAAAVALAGRLLDGEMEWANVLYDRPSSLAEAPEAIALNAGVGFELAKDWLGQMLPHHPDAPPAEGEGLIDSSGLKPVGVCTVGGRTTRVSGVCTHLGGVLGWNDAEQSWDCPLHGSRFTHDGIRLEGPAVRDLSRLPDDAD